MKWNGSMKVWIAVLLALGSVTASAHLVQDVVKKGYGDLMIFFKYHLKGEGDIVYSGRGCASRIMIREYRIKNKRNTVHQRQKARRHAKRIVLNDMVKTYNGNLAAQARAMCGEKFVSYDTRIKHLEDADWIMIDRIDVWARDEDDATLHKEKRITPGKGRFRCENGRAIHVLPHNTHRRNGPPVVHGDGGSATGGRAAPPPPPSLRRGRAAPPPPPSPRRDGGSGR